MKTFLSALRPKTRRPELVTPAQFAHGRRRFLAGEPALLLPPPVLITGAIIYPGFKTAEVELNDGGVWVVSKSKNAVGRLNYPSRVLDGAVTPAWTTFDVLQDAGTVLVDDSAGSTLNQVSAAQMRLGGDKKLPGSAEVSFGSKVIAVTDAAKGYGVGVVAVDGGRF